VTLQKKQGKLSNYGRLEPPGKRKKEAKRTVAILGWNGAGWKTKEGNTMIIGREVPAVRTKGDSANEAKTRGEGSEP